ncbi:LOW QUALITY PROTEIN: folylpolyglutamate synthase, mitochondrial [Drosophila eugracilis]|uniref:LOW QUALITY PROTEIN: folylpolyglutamate synthase, mitochondrial n=1 Tax=Drosophila eugracilis TaxID=29029 RepID=UPI001BD99D12|nr:LOW QUALITY PROTEIN: folylpolyglutamate synthase, mitochondrial [Drosophila eugracilis]
MHSLLPLLYRRQSSRLKALQWSIHSSQTFFKMSFKAPSMKASKVSAIKELPKKQTPTQTQPSQSQSSATQQSQPTQPSKIQNNPLGLDTINSGQSKIVTPKPTVQPNIPDQRAKWLAKVSPEMQRKAKLAEGKGSPPSGPPKNQFTQGNNPSFGMASQNPAPNFGAPPRTQPAWQPKPEKQDDQNSGAFKGASSESQRKNWMNRMQGSQQKKQNQWLKEMQAKQQAGKDMQAQKIQKMGIPKATATSTPLQEAAQPTPAAPEIPEEKSPERLAYLDAIKQLNSYQVLEPTSGRATTKSSRDTPDPVIEQTMKCLEKTGFTKTQLEAIPVIQVAGSKGRGSTCAIVENILRCHGVKTGTLCSPHLFLTSERIRIDGEPLDDVQFTELFWKINTELTKMKPPPSYNKLMTVMAFHAFHQAGVEVAILEVGNGGASDSTNIASHAQTIGITTLGWEQSSNLGNSLRDIAWAKAAIMKPEANIYTNVTQTECCEVLAQKAKQIGVQLRRVPTFNDYIEGNMNNKLLMNKANYTMRLNGSLGIQLAYDFLRRHRPEYVVGVEENSTLLTPGATRGIETFEQAGQFDFIRHDMFNVYLDSADTFESMMACRDWFYTKTRSNRQPKILLFNKVNEFNAKDLLTIIRSNLRFEEACFVPNPNYFEGEILAEDDGKAMVWHGMEELQRAKRNAGNWRALCEENGKRDNSQLSISINAFFEYLTNKYGKQKYGMKNELDVLVTGSRQLVAATISCLRKMKSSNPWQ